ncbi:hypothetical protein U9M48_006106 [Paspalum notatum var. saurae]|uniref:Uncharacterized protein n=1 Tax=Paspalum notatum var. saurae TaxID=547442 RepID=A0AAQ3PY27_PASNO
MSPSMYGSHALDSMIDESPIHTAAARLQGTPITMALLSLSFAAALKSYRLQVLAKLELQTKATQISKEKGAELHSILHRQESKTVRHLPEAARAAARSARRALASVRPPPPAVASSSSSSAWRRISRTRRWELECSSAEKVGLLMGRYSGNSRPDLKRTPHALHSVLGPAGPCRHCGVSTDAQCVHRRRGASPAAAAAGGSTGGTLHGAVTRRRRRKPLVLGPTAWGAASSRPRPADGRDDGAASTSAAMVSTEGNASMFESHSSSSSSSAPCPAPPPPAGAAANSNPCKNGTTPKKKTNFFSAQHIASATSAAAAMGGTRQAFKLASAPHASSSAAAGFSSAASPPAMVAAAAASRRRDKRNGIFYSITSTLVFEMIPAGVNQGPPLGFASGLSRNGRKMNPLASIQDAAAHAFREMRGASRDRSIVLSRTVKTVSICPSGQESERKKPVVRIVAITHRSSGALAWALLGCFHDCTKQAA